MRLIIIFMTTFAISACLPLKQSSYLVSFVKEKPLSTLPEVRDVQVSGDRKTIKVENRAVVPYFEVIFHDINNPIFSETEESNEQINSKLVGIPVELLQRVTDQSYRYFMSEMKAQGIEILPISSLSNSQTYQKFLMSRTEEKVDVMSISPSGMKLPNLSDIKGKQISKIMDEMNASVMDVTLYVNHMDKIQDEASISTNGLKVEQKISVTSGSRMKFFGLEASRCQGYCLSPVVSAKLGKSIYSTEKVGDLVRKIKISEKIEPEKQTAMKQGDLKSQAIDLSRKAVDLSEKAIDWVSTLSAKDDDAAVYELHADPVEYEKIVSQILRDSTKKLVHGITYYDPSDIKADK
jgi:hypothetical protein